MFRIDRSLVSISNEQDAPFRPEKPKASDRGAAEHTARLEAEIEEARKNAEELAERIIQDAEREAGEIKAKADMLLEEAKRDSEIIRAEAKVLGYEEGKEKAEADYTGFIKENDKALNNVLAEIERGRERMFKELETEVIDLCFAIIRKMATMDREKDGEIFKSIIKKALNQMDSAGRFTVRLSNEDFERFFPTGEATFAVGDGQVTVTVVGDPALSGGEIFAESENESVTAGADVQIRNIELAFRQKLGKRDEEN